MSELEKLERDIPSLKGLSAHFRDVLQPQLADCDRMQRQGWVHLGMGAAFFIGALFLGVLTYELVMLAGAALVLYLAVMKIKDARAKARTILIGAVADRFGFAFLQEDLEGDFSKFEELRLLRNDGETKVMQALTGSVDDVAFELLGVKVLVWKHRDKLSFQDTVFKGLVGVFDCPRPVSGITAKTSQGIFNTVISWFSRTPGEYIKTGDRAFDKHFAVSAIYPKQVDAVLTPEFRARMVAFDQSTKGDVQFAFTGQKFLLTIGRMSQWLGMRGVFQSLSSEGQAVAVLWDVLLVHHMVDMLKSAQKEV